MNLEAFYNVILTLIIVLAIGFVGRKVGIINDTVSKALSTLVVKICQPFMIIGAIINVEYSTENLKNGFLVLGMSFAMHIFMAIIAHFTVFKFKSINERKICEFATIFGNCGFIGFPLIESLLGPTGLFYGGFLLIAFNTFTWTWGLVVLGKGREDIKINPKSMILNYGTLPSIIGLVLYVARVPIPVFVGSAVSYLSSVCTPVSVLITGALIGTVSLKEFFKDVKVYYISAIKLVFMPVIIAIIMLLLGIDSTYVIFMVVMSAMPVASTTVMFGELFEIEKKKASILVGMSSVLSMATLPCVITVLDLII